MKKLSFLLALLVVSATLTTPSFAQVDPDTSVDNETEVETTSETEVDPEAEDEIVNSDQTEPFETGITEEDEIETTSTVEADIDVQESEITGEVIEITDDYIVIRTEAGEEVQISRGGGTLLSPFVRQAPLTDVKVGDNVELTVAESVTLEGEVKGVTENGAIVVVTEDGQERTIQSGLNGVIVRNNGKIVTDFTTLEPGDEVEVSYQGELISAVETDDSSAGGWVTPVIIILIVLGLAAVLARRGKQLE